MIASNLYGFDFSSKRLRVIGRRMNFNSWSNRLALFLIVAGVVSGFATYGALSEMPPFGKDPDTVIWLLNLDLIILLVLVSLVARRLAGLWSGRQRGIAGSRLHMRLVFIFALLATAPAIIMALFSAFFFHFGVQSWFSDRVRTAVVESQAVAEAYLEEHQEVIRADIMAMAHDLDLQAPLLLSKPEAFEKVIRTQSLLRNLSEAIVFDAGGRVLASSGLTFSLELETLPGYALRQAEEGEVVLMTGESDDRVRALVKLDSFLDAYLYVGRMVDPVVLSHLTDTREAAHAYAQLEKQLSDLQVTVSMIFTVMALLLLLGAIWFGLTFARQLVLPIGSLISASDRVSAGDLSARVPAFDRIDEFDVLARAFNRMTSQIQEQREELVAANAQLDQRRRFIEAVLAGVSSGIVGINEREEITLANMSAAELFGFSPETIAGTPVTSAIPGIAALLEQAHQKPGRVTQTEIPYIRKDNAKRILLVRIAAEKSDGGEKSAVLTFDDITELQSAQRKAAWADVARRIAHEIRNPLTPIQLSAERLKRKYLKQIKEDAEIFSQCTDTIIHHVDDIGRMVQEFSAFARMPEPVMKEENLSRCLRDILALEKEAHPGIDFVSRGLDGECRVVFDSRQIRQAFTNILHNAAESVQTRVGNEGGRGRIDVLLAPLDRQGACLVCVTDNGLGFPKNEDPERLTEPYVTHREKGTGLGLAIVKKIMEDHGGRLVMGAPDWLKTVEGWQDRGGATVSLLLPVRKEMGTDRPGGPDRIEVAS